jgi:hypothetical protein
MFCAYCHGTETETIYQDAMYSGSGQMVEASGVGIPVGITPVRTFGADEYRDAIRLRG